jgi:Tol biopolymer transport system component
MMSKYRILPLVLLIILVGHSLSTRQSANAQNHECIQLIDGYGIVEEVVTIDTQTYQPVVDSRFVIPPDALQSPDGTHAVFWHGKGREQGMYISSTETVQPRLIHRPTRQSASDSSAQQSTTDYTDIPILYTDESAAWSPDSSKFAFVDIDNDQHFIIALNADGSNRQKKPIPSPELEHPISVANLLGWSGDSQYVAAYVGYDPETPNQYPYTTERAELHVWTADLKEIEIGIVPDTDYFGNEIAAAWSPVGHKLAVQLFSVPKQGENDDYFSSFYGFGTKLAIWSPEHGIEIQNLADAANIPRGETRRLYWSPDGTHLRLYLYEGHQSNDMIFGIRRKQIVGNVDQIRRFKQLTSLQSTEFIGWTSNGSALMLDTDVEFTYNPNENEYDSSSELYLLNVNTGNRRLLERNAFAPTMSSNGYYVAMKRDNQAVKLIDLRTFKETAFEGSERGMSTWLPNDKYVGFGDYLLYKGHTNVLVDVETMETLNLNMEYIQWLSDEWIIYAIQRKDTYHLEVRNLKTEVVYDLGELEHNVGTNAYEEKHLETYVMGSISPDERYLVTLLDRHTLIVVSLEDGTQTKRNTAVNFWSRDHLYSGPAASSFLDYSLAWSPDSSELAFVETFGSDDYLVILGQSGNELQKVLLPDTFAPKFNGFITWTQCQ